MITAATVPQNDIWIKCYKYILYSIEDYNLFQIVGQRISWGPFKCFSDWNNVAFVFLKIEMLLKIHI